MKKSLILFITIIQTTILTNAQQHSFPLQYKNYAFVASSPAVANGAKCWVGSMRIMSPEPPEMTNIRKTLHTPKAGSYVDWINTDSSGAVFYLANVKPGDAIHYEYRLVENNKKILLPWTTITSFIPNFIDGEGTMGELGAYKTAWGNFINMEIRPVVKSPSAKDENIVAITAAVYWAQIKPIVKNIYQDTDIKELFSIVLSTQEPESPEKSISSLKNEWQHLNAVKDTEVITEGINKLILNDTVENLIFGLRQTHIFHREMIEYKLSKNDVLINDWQPNDFDNNFIWLKHLYPGKYKLNIRFSMQRHNKADYEFEIKAPPKPQPTSFKILTGSLIVAFFAFIILLLRVISQRKKIRSEKLKKEKTQRELKAIRLQLNPHFVFNSLNSIQGLINNNKIDSANKYLSDFAGLMRKSLTENDKENCNLSGEIKFLENYLQLEQLRFHFNYIIEVNKDINASEIEIPSLLLQPLVENAVKHGVSASKEKGIIKVVFSKSGNDLVASIIDNGKGFNPKYPNPGYGLKLTRDRIALINEMHKTQMITLDIQHNEETVVQLTFQNRLG